MSKRHPPRGGGTGRGDGKGQPVEPHPPNPASNRADKKAGEGGTQSGPSTQTLPSQSTKSAHQTAPVKQEAKSLPTPPDSKPPKPSAQSLPSRPPYYHSSSVDGAAGGADSRSWYQQEPSRQRSRSLHFPWWSQNRQRVHLPERQLRCPPDIEEYRKEYPTMKDNQTMNANRDFYTGKKEFQPRGTRIDKILQNWWGKYDILEHRHDYIQWLFPTRDGSAMSYSVQPLQKHEIEAICGDKDAMSRVLESYKMMLDFYGMKLTDTGDLERNSNWQERFAHLDHSIHNHMRITRILKSLGELNHEYLKAPFVRFILHTIFEGGYLVNTLESCMKYWVETIRDENDRDSLWLLARELDGQKHSKH